MQVGIALGSSQRDGAGCSRSGASSSGAGTPPLTIEGGSSFSDESGTIIDLAQIDTILSRNLDPAKLPPKACLTAGLRPPSIQGDASLWSMGDPMHNLRKEDSFNPLDLVFDIRGGEVVDPFPSISLPTTATTFDSDASCDQDARLVALGKYHAFKTEVEELLLESKRTWRDTPLSYYAVQCRCTKRDWLPHTYTSL